MHPIRPSADPPGIKRGWSLDQFTLHQAVLSAGRILVDPPRNSKRRVALKNYEAVFLEQHWHNVRHIQQRTELHVFAEADGAQLRSVV